MRYVSTRGQAPVLGFCDTLLAGLASDGGLYVPAEWPQVPARDIRALRGRPYAEVAFRVMRPFVGDEIPPDDLRGTIVEACGAFRHPAVAPLTQTGANRFILELFHGPTLAFKDIAMQLLARLMDDVLARRGERAIVVGATSGDTGGAAVAALAGRLRADLFVLFPNGRVSPVQRRQMTARADVNANARAIAIDGTFDDCQKLVKAMFNGDVFGASVRLSGVNSINWARIMAQIVYYFSAATALGAPDRTVSFTVPTGNFGDIFAGYCAKRMGLPIDRLVIATNGNDILARTLESGRYQPREVVVTSSPSMDVQVSSNFERLLFEALDRDGEAVRTSMAALEDSGGFIIAPNALETIRAGFRAGWATEAQTATAIRETLEQTGVLLDPHTAVGVHVARQFETQDAPMVTLATAHPAKFPDAVKSACGLDPAPPPCLRDLMDREERFVTLPPDFSAVTAFIAGETHAIGNREA